jgi:DNA-binding transcriptional ArsR family regulator
MLEQLKAGESSVSDLAKPYNMSLPAVTKHIKVLEKAGLITKTKEAQWRPCKLKEDGLKEVSDWMEEYRVFFEASFDRLEAYLKTVTVQQSSEPTAKAAPDEKQVQAVKQVKKAKPVKKTKQVKKTQREQTGKKGKNNGHRQ